MNISEVEMEKSAIKMRIGKEVSQKLIKKM